MTSKKSSNHSLVNLFSKISKLVMTYFKNDVDTHSFNLAISRQKTGFCLVNRSEAWFLADNSLKMCGDVIFEMSLSLVSQIKVLG